MTSKEFNHCLDKIRNKDTQGLEEIYYEYYNKLIFTAFNIVNEFVAAEDIASDFLKYILENAKNIDYIEKPDSWILQAIRNRAVSYIRKESRKIKISNCADEMFSTNYDYDLKIILTESFKVLTEYERNLVLLHFVYEIKYKEISSIIGRPIGTIKSDISIIRKKLLYLKNGT